MLATSLRHETQTTLCCIYYVCIYSVNNVGTRDDEVYTDIVHILFLFQLETYTCSLNGLY